ncbi:MAG: hypothetical protein H7836_08085 [Magnetococcus sp. YQC-3]
MDDYSKLKDLLVTFLNEAGLDFIKFDKYYLHCYKKWLYVIPPEWSEELVWDINKLIKFAKKENLIEKLTINLEEYLIGRL